MSEKPNEKTRYRGKFKREVPDGAEGRWNEIKKARAIKLETEGWKKKEKSKNGGLKIANRL